MSTAIASNGAIDQHRRGSGDRGLIRLEVKASKADAPLIRKLAKTLRGASPEAGLVREQLRRVIGATTQPADLKTLLASAPLDGIDLSRSRDRGRTIDL